MVGLMVTTIDGGSQKALGDGTAELSLVVIATETETVAGNTAEFWQKPRNVLGKTVVHSAGPPCGHNVSTIIFDHH